MAKSPFRDRELADKHRSERAQNDERVRAEEEAAEAARERQRRKELMRKGAPFAGLSVVVWGVVRLVGVLGSVDERQAEEGRRRELAAAVAATKPTLVSIDQGGVRPTAESLVTPDWVRTVVDGHADELAGCFSDGLGTGALAMGPGPSHAFAFSWVIEADGTVTNARSEHGAQPGAPSSDVERCMIDRLRTWTFGDMKAKADVVAWMFERCPTSRAECVHRKDP